MWKEEDDTLQAEFKFANFTKAFAFMTEVAFVAEKLDHHPEWSNIYNTVNIKLTTHDAGNTITNKDRTMAKAIDSIFEEAKL